LNNVLYVWKFVYHIYLGSIMKSHQVWRCEAN